MLTPRRDDAGAVAVLTVLVVTFVAMPLLALVVDLGISRSADGQASTAADSAALAAAVRLAANPSDQAGAAATARQLVQDNFAVQPGAWATCLDAHPLPAGTPATPGDCVSMDLTLRRVRVTVPARTVPSVFAGVLGTTPPAASATSTATWGPAPVVPTCTLCVVGTAGGPGTYDGGDDDVDVANGDVAVAGTINVGSGGSLQADSGHVITYAGASSSGPVSPAAVPGPAPADPLAGQVAAVRAAALAAPPGVPVGGVCPPGVYTTFTNCTIGFSGSGVYVVVNDPSATFRTTVTLGLNMSNAVVYVTCARLFTFPAKPQDCSTFGSTPKPKLATTGSPVLNGSATYGGLALAFDPSATATQRLQPSPGTFQVNGAVAGAATTFRDTASCNGRMVVNGTLVAGGVQFTTCGAGLSVLTVTGPAPAAAVPAGVRLLPSTP